MKRFVFLCVLLAGAAFAAETNLGNLGNGGVTLPGQFPGTDDVITSQPFSFENLQNGLGFQNGSGYTWMLADDITPAGDTPITDIEIWDCYSGSQMTGLKVQIRADGGSRPTGDPLYSYETTNITHTTTGLFAWGSYELFDVVATIDPANAYSPTPAPRSGSACRPPAAAAPPTGAPATRPGATCATGPRTMVRTGPAAWTSGPLPTICS